MDKRSVALEKTMGISSERSAAGWGQCKDLLWKKVIPVTVLFNCFLQSTPVQFHAVSVIQ